MKWICRSFLADDRRGISLSYAESSVHERIYVVIYMGRNFYMRTIKSIRNIPLKYGMLLMLFFLGLTFGSMTVRAENISGTDNNEINVDPTGNGEGYAAVVYNNSNGLPTSEANAIAETKEGFLWIGSYSGLIRYDGSTFERIDSTTGVTSVVSLYVDSKERLWIGTNDNGVAYMEKGDITFYKDVEGLKSSSIRSIVEDNEGNIFIATTFGLGYIDTDMQIHALDESQLNSEYICELRKDDKGVIYGETMAGAVFTIENMRVTGFYDGNQLGLGVLTTILPDPENPGYVYLGTENSDIYYGSLDNNLKDVKKIDVSPLSYIFSMEYIGGELWVCSNSGVGVIKNGKFNALNKLPLNNSVGHMLADYEGNLWFTSTRQGVMKIVPNNFTDINQKYGLGELVVNSTCVMDDKLFIGTDTGLQVIDKERGRLGEYKMSTLNGKSIEKDNLITLLRDCRIRSIIKDSKDRLWISTYSQLGLVRYDHGDVVTFGTADGLPSERIRVAIELSDGNMAIACSGGVAIIQDDEIIKVYDETNGLSNPEALTICEGFNGELVVGSDGNGIFIINNDSIKNIGSRGGLSSEVILRIKRDDERKLFWIVTSNSISYMKDEKVTTVEKFPYSNNFDIYEDNEENMWVLSSNGIYIVQKQELIDNKEIETVFLNKDNGLASVATANSYSYMDEEGNLYISGSAGVTKVDIYKPLEDVSKTKMSVPFVEADGEMIYAEDDGSIVIPSNVKRVTVFSYVYTYSLFNPKVTYHLEGFDNDKTTVDRTELEPIDYTNLDGGTYHFVMELQNTMGQRGKEIEVTLVKKKAFYEKLWFKILTAVVLLAILALIVSAYVKKKTQALAKKQKENRIFIREMTEAFAKVIDVKDSYTNGHSTRVAEYTAMLAKELGYNEDDVEKYYNIALLHDIGKITISKDVLNKPGQLSDKEFNIIKSHSAKGYEILKDISIMPELAIGAGAHHERPDGKGYPKGLKGKEIPRVAQIIAVADTFDAMYSDRPYRKRMNFEKAVSIIKEVSGTQLESDVVDAFLRLVEKGEFRAEDDEGGGTFEDINNIHKQQQRKNEEAKKNIKNRLNDIKNENDDEKSKEE